MRKKIIGVIAGLVFTTQVQAIPIVESGDATDLLPGQSVADGTTSISGSLGAGGDITDLYAFTWVGGILTIDTIGSAFDTQLHLFDGAGFGIGENDDGNRQRLHQSRKPLTVVHPDLGRGTQLGFPQGHQIDRWPAFSRDLQLNCHSCLLDTAAELKTPAQ